MSSVPRFIIVAGPNGAGKSTHGQAFVPAGVSIFNGDLVFAALCEQYPSIAPERLKGGVAVALERSRDEALKQKTDFAFETNFSNDLVIELMAVFRNQGYEIELLYFGLADLETSISRVKTRTALGGHDIPNDLIRFNYKEGIRMLKENLSAFDYATFISTSLRAEILAHFNKAEKKLTLAGQQPSWFTLHFKTALTEIFDQKMITQRKRGRRI